MTALDRARLWWQRTTGEEETPLDGDTPAWVVSLLVHVGALLALAAAMIRPDRPSSPPITILQSPADPQEPVEDVFTPPDEFVVAEPAETAGAQSADGAEVAASLAPLVAETPEVPVEVPELFATGDIQVDLPEPDALPEGLLLTESVAVRGDVAVGTAGAEGAVDRLTAEIRASLQQRPTVVAWVFDQSVSLAGQRKEIAARLDRVFEELGANGSASKQPDLTNVVFAYGRKVMPVVFKPTRQCRDVVRAIESIPVDESGIEMTFTALAEAAKRAKEIRVGPARRNVMIICFTDEVGDDQQYADQVASFCRAQAMRVYVVGVPAPFGRRQVQVRFVEFDPRYAADDQFPVVDQGPETLHPEVVQIHSGGVADEPIDSGFGPYSLSKVCAETGGIYFSVHANRRTGGRVAETAPMASRLRSFFDGDVMRAYRPDYLAVAKVDQLIAANRAKQALVDAARSVAVSPMAEPRMVFPREDDGQFVSLLGEAQKVAAVRAPKIDALHDVLVRGQEDRDRLGPTEKRWQAGYDLALGRVLAAKVRTDAYNLVLAQAKSGMTFRNPRNDTWCLVASDAVTNVGSQAEKLAAQARMYLERVVREHPGTPWSLIAQEELKTPLGYAWQEAFTDVAARKDGEGVGNGRERDDVKREVARPKPRPEPSRLG